MKTCPECGNKRTVEGPMNHRTGPNPKRIPCPECSCEMCDGSGEVMLRFGGMEGEITCRVCEGTGVADEYR